MARKGLTKQPAISRTTIMVNFETKVLAVLTFIDLDSLACVCGILGLVAPEQKKGNLKLLLKFIIRQFCSEDAEGIDDGGCSWYGKLHDYLA